MARSNFIVRGGADFSSIKKELTKTQTQLQNFQSKVSGIMKGIGTILGSLAVGKFIKESTKAAMGVESAMDNISRNMGSASKAFQNWVNTQSQALGMAKADAYNYGSVFSNLLSSFTSSTEETAKQTQELMKAAAIIASKTGRTYEDVADRIRSGMLGSTEAIEDLGVYVNISMLEATDAFKKFAGNKSWSQLTFQQQQQIRLAAILEQTYKRYGDTLADTTQTRQAQFLASLKNIQLTLGQAFLSIYNAVLPALTAMADAINRVVSIFAQFTQALFGKAATSQAKTTQQQAAAMTELGDATEEAGKQAKNALMGFDEIHQLAEESAETGAAAEIAPAGAVPATEEIVSEEEPNKMAEMAEKFKKAFEPAVQAFERLKEAAEPIIQNVGKGLKWLYDNVLLPFGSWTISAAIPAFFDLLAGALAFLNPVLEAFKILGQWLWDNFLQPIASWTGQAFVDSMGLVSDVLRTLGDWMAQNGDMVIAGLSGILTAILAYQAIKTVPKVIDTFESFRGVVDGILKSIADVATWLWQNVLVPFGQFLATIFVAAWDAVKSAAMWLWQNVLVPIGEFLLWFWESVLVPVGTILMEYLGIAFQTVADIARSFWENVLVPLGQALGEMLVAAIEAVTAMLESLWNNIFVPFGNFLKGIYIPVVEALVKVFEFFWQNVLKPLAQFIGGVFVEVFDNMFRTINSIIEGLKNIFVGLMKFITGVFTGSWEKAWEGVKQIFKGVFDSLWGIVKFPLNLIIDGINTVIRALNSISIDVPDWVPGLGGKKFGINIPLIPKLARGAIVTSPTIAMIGERGPEAVVPLENTGFVDAIASAVGTAVLSAIQMAQGNSNQPVGGDIVLKIDGATFARIINPYLNREQTRIGDIIISAI